MNQKKTSGGRKKRKQQRNRRIIMFIAGLVVIGLIWLGILFWIGGNQKRETQKSEKPDVEQQTPEAEETPTPTAAPTAAEEPVPTEEPLPAVDLNGIYSKSGILIRLSDDTTVAEKEADTRIYPASMTKIMTAVVVLENMPDLEQTVTLPPEMFDSLYEEGASMAGYAPGDQVKALDLLYGVMLPSGAECCIGFADHLFGSEEAFAAKMNEKAQELGMTNTHFVTSTGLHDPEHYTTVRDIAKLLQYALQNETFRTIYCTHEYTSTPTAGTPEGLHFYSTMFKKMETDQVNGGSIKGGKTGYTSDAGLCLASLAEVEGTEYIFVSAGADGSQETEPFHILDAAAVYNQIAQPKESGEPAPPETSEPAA